jgi:hypothetical protein
MNGLSEAQAPGLGYNGGREKEDLPMKYLKIFTDFLDVTASLSDGALGRLFRAMLRYAREGAATELKGKEAVAWVVARQHIDREAEAYENMVEARREAGRRSGQARKQKEQAATTTNKTNQDKDKDKEKDNDKDKDKDKYIYMGGKPPEAPAPKAHINIYSPPL